VLNIVVVFDRSGVLHDTRQDGCHGNDT
jgi:hypothetical protein